MSSQSTQAESSGLREHLASGVSLLSVLAVTFLAIGAQKPEILGVTAPDLAAWGMSFSGDATVLAIVAIIGVTLISRRNVTL